MILLLATVSSILAADPLPLDMPRAEPYLVREGSRRYMEDRFNRLDLWVSRTVDGRWMDDDGRVFTYSTLREFPPSRMSADTTLTRSAYVRSAGPVAEDDVASRRRAAEMIAPADLAAECTEARMKTRAFSEIEYWQGTNETFIACTFRPRHDDTWRIATWALVEGDEFDAMHEKFEEMLFRMDGSIYEKMQSLPSAGPERGGTEREYLRADAGHSVAAYSSWHVTDADEFTVLDELPGGGAFIDSLTNELSVMRRRYSETLPSPLDGTNVLCVARIFSSRDRYLDSLEVAGITNMLWSAAYWSPVRRELVAYLPEGGASALLKTFRHEAFHQYLTYACSAIAASPWLNEGYAQYFEEGPAGTPPESVTGVSACAEMLPALFAAGYREFYSGTAEERRIKYLLALSVACFLEHGAPKVRFEPFKNVKRDYIEALLETKDMRAATLKAFRDRETFDLFIDEWREFWENLGS